VISRVSPLFVSRTVARTRVPSSTNPISSVLCWSVTLGNSVAHCLMMGSNMSCGARSRFCGLSGGHGSKARPGNFSRPNS
jgi:hypothetical protein